MKSAIVSVGLNVGAAEPAGQYEKTVASIGKWLLPEPRIALFDSEFEGVPERAVQQRVMAPCLDSLYVRAGYVARELGQECVGLLFPGGQNWLLVYATGHAEMGGTVEEFPARIR